MNVSLAWELVCHRLDILAVVRLFQTCRDLRSLSRKEGLWSTLSQRDYPMHYLFVATCDHAWFYKDLYKYGAFWNIGKSIVISPGRPMFVAPVQNCGYDMVYISTNTVRGHCDHEMLRFPGEQWVRVIHTKEISRDAIKGLKSASIFFQSGREFVFIREKIPEAIPDCYELRPIKPWDGSRFEAILSYLHEHFMIERITMKYGAWGKEVFYIKATLRKGHLLRVPFHDMDEEWRDDLVQISETLSGAATEYKVYQTQSHFDEYKCGELHSTATQICFRSVNQIELPLW